MNKKPIFQITKTPMTPSRRQLKRFQVREDIKHSWIVVDFSFDPELEVWLKENECEYIEIDWFHAWKFPNEQIKDWFLLKWS